MPTLIIGSFLGCLASLIAAILVFRQRSILQVQYNALMERYRPVSTLKNEISALRSEYESLQRRYKERRETLKSFEELIDNYQVGIGTIDANTYTPLFTSRDLSLLEMELDKVRDNAKTLVKEKLACVSKLPKDTVLNGRKGAAKTFVNREIRLRIRCLDNEVKAAIAMVDWNNINRLVARVEQKWTDINSESEMVKIFLTREYLDTKIRELRLCFEIKELKAELKEEEREERQRLREEQRDEERLKAELAKAERDRIRMEKLVERELARISQATEVQREKLALHQKELVLLRDKEKRALSMAQKTRAGYVYIISNEVSFGAGVCKIGMTRRLDPNDRVKELGDASVPELFTVHAFIYTDDAPTLEKFFHDKLNSHRVNLVNRRKEFFHVKADDALELLKEFNGSYSIEPIDV